MSDYLKLCDEHSMTTGNNFYIDDTDCPWCIVTTLRAQLETAQADAASEAKSRKAAQDEVKRLKTTSANKQASIDGLLSGLRESGKECGAMEKRLEQAEQLSTRKSESCARLVKENARLLAALHFIARLLNELEQENARLFAENQRHEANYKHRDELQHNIEQENARLLAVVEAAITWRFSYGTSKDAKALRAAVDTYKRQAIKEKS